jgi:hypothetical protein
MSQRKYMILDTRQKALVVDDARDPVCFPTLDEALARAVALRGRKSPESFAVLDDLGNKWMWSKKKVMRIALSFDTKDAIDDAVDVDWEKHSSTLQTRCRPDGIVETSHRVRLPDGPPVPIMLHGRPMGDRTTTQRWTEKPSWVERGSLASFIEALPTRIHKLEQRAMNEKDRGLRAEAKALRLQADHEAGDQMTCQLCGRLIRSKHGVIAHHGYTRPGGGWQTASCDGTHHPPLEVSNRHLLDTIADFEKRCEAASRRIENVKGEREPIVVQVKPHWSENRRYPYVFEFTRQTYDAVRAASEGRLTAKVTFDEHKSGFVSVLKDGLRMTKVILSELRERNKGWRQTRKFVDGEFRPLVEIEARSLSVSMGLHPVV